MNYTYVIECADQTYYTGWTNDIQKRMIAHQEGKGAKYTKSRAPIRLRYYEEFATKQEAMKREWAIKQLRREQKEALLKTPLNPTVKELIQKINEELSQLEHEHEVAETSSHNE